MAKFSELRQSPVPVEHFDLDSFAEHLPRYVREANDNFVAANKGFPGVLDYDASGFTEPEDERDCYANNLALSNFDAVKPYLERMNTHLTPEQIESDDYSMHALHLAAECYQASMNGVSKENIDHLIDMSIEKDFDYFGSKHYEYSFCSNRKFFENGYTLEQIQLLDSVPSHAQQSVDFYLNDNPFNEEAIRVISNTKDMGESYAIYSCISARPSDEDKMTLEQARVTSECIDMIRDHLKSGGDNPKVKITYPDGDSSEIERLSPSYAEGYVSSYARLINSNAGIAENPNKLKAITADFIALGGDERWIDAYAEANPHDIDMRVRSMGDDKYALFYADSHDSHGASAKDVNEFAAARGMKVAFGMESDGFNGDTFICYGEDKSTMPPYMKTFVEAKEQRAASKESEVSSKENKEISNEPVVLRSVFVSDKDKNNKPYVSKKGDAYCSVTVSVPEGYLGSADGKVRMTCNPSQVSVDESGNPKYGSTDVTFKPSAKRTVQVQQADESGTKYVSVQNVSVAEIAEKHQENMRNYAKSINKAMATSDKSASAQAEASGPDVK